MGSQLTFDILLNPSVRAEDEKRLSRQARKILALLLERTALGLTVDTSELNDIACQYNARIFEVRLHLARFGLFVDKVGTHKHRPGVNHYQIVPFEKSTFPGKERFLSA